jgi:hypothetical protein
MNVKERVTVGFCFDHHAPKFASLHAFLFSIFIETFCIWHQDHRQKKEMWVMVAKMFVFMYNY